MLPEPVSAAWDGRPLALLTRTAPVRATAAHIAVIGHITAAELAAHTSAVESANGFLNRFCFIACRRHRLLPDGGDLDLLGGTGMAERLGGNLSAARRAGRVYFDVAARLEWHDLYAQLSAATDGLVGSLTARAEAHVLRLATLDALIDGDTVIRPAHLQAGLALWDYAARSITWAMRHTTADPVGEQIRTALAALGAQGLAQRHRRATAGRPAEIWVTTTKP